MNEKDIGCRIKERRIELNLTLEQMANALGLNKSTILRYENGQISNIKLPIIQSIAKILNVNPNWLILKSEDRDICLENSTTHIHQIPILGYIAAGLPLYADEQIQGYICTEHNDGAEYFALKVKGDSMSAAHINDGNIIIVRRQDFVENGDIAVVRVDQENATVKRFRQDGNTLQLIPQSFNPEHQVQIYNLNDTNISIIGKVIECRIKF